MKKTLLLLFMLSSAYIVQAQVAINATGANPDASAGLDVSFTNKGLLIPRVALTATTDATTIATPAYSTLVYNLGTGGLSPAGYYYNAGTSVVPNWVRFLNSKEAWLLAGNTGTSSGTDFLGTTDAQDLLIKTNNNNRILVESNATLYPVVGIGTMFPVENLDGTGTGGLLHVHDGGTGLPSSIIIGTHSTTSGVKTGSLNFAATQVTNNRRTGSIESYLTAYAAPNASGDLRFFTNNVNSYTEKMRIIPDGNVGIGTTAPTQKLHIAGNSLTTGDAYIYTATNGSIHWGTAGLRGAASSFVPNAGAAGLWIEGSQDGESGGMFMNGNTFCIWSPGDNDIFRVYDEDLFASGPQMVLNGSGYLGVGLNLSPAERIHTSGNIRADGIVYWGSGLVRTETRSDAGLRGDAGAKSGFFEFNQPSGNSQDYNYPAGYAGSTWWHLIDSRHSNNGNNYALQISGNFFDQDLYYRKTNNNAAQPWTRILTASNGGVTTSCGTVNYVPKMTTASNIGCSQIYDNGTNVGINNASPSYKLDVYGASGTYPARVANPDGYLTFGPANTGWCHFATDRARFFFNTGGTFETGNIGSYDENLSLQTSGTTRITALNSNGYVGIGTTAPTALLNISGAHSTTQMRLTLPAAANGGGTGEVNLQLWTSEPGVTWDAGGIGTNVTNDGGAPAGFGRINATLGQSYIRFITNGGAMAFNTADNAGNYYQTMYMVGGNVGIGTTAPTYKLHVIGRFKSDGINETSDIRLKKNIQPIANALSKVMLLQGVTYEWNKEGMEEGTQLGLIAQEVEKVIPELVDNDSEGYKSIRYSVMVALLIEAMKDQQAEYNKMQTRMQQMESDMTAVKAQLGIDKVSSVTTEKKSTSE